MSLLQRFLGVDPPSRASRKRGETESVRQIAAQLERLPSETARRLAAFAYVLARVAHADLDSDPAEIAEMERIVTALGNLDPDQGALVVRIAQSRTEEMGGTENFLVTREYRERSSHEERVELIECLFAVAAADGSISTLESQEVISIAEELGFSRRDALALRSRWRDHLAELQGLRDR